MDSTLSFKAFLVTARFERDLALRCAPPSLSKAHMSCYSYQGLPAIQGYGLGQGGRDELDNLIRQPALEQRSWLLARARIYVLLRESSPKRGVLLISDPSEGHEIAFPEA